LDHVHKDFAEAIIAAGNRSGTAATDDAIKKVAEAWRRAFDKAPSGALGRYGRIGLLHLQALLYAFHGEFGLLGDDAMARVSDAEPTKLFADAMREAIQLKLARCRAAAADPAVQL